MNRRWLCSATARWLGTIIIAADEALERSRVTILAEAASCGMSLVGSKKNMRPALSKNARGVSPICRRGQMLGVLTAGRSACISNLSMVVAVAHT